MDRTDCRVEAQIEVAKRFVAAGEGADGFRFWDADRGSWYLVGAEEMAELGEMMQGRPAEKLQCYQTWIDMYCDKVDPDQANGCGHQI
jgi:hypothetical protein